MKTKLIRNIFCAGVFIALYSCTPAYIPNVINSPMLSNQGELQVSAHYGSSGIDPQIAVGITDNVGLILNGSFDDNKSDSSKKFHRHRFGEIGVGYYGKMGTKGRYEVYGGYGYGELQAFYENAYWQNYQNVITSRIFLQPAIGMSSEIVDLSFATRFAYLDLYQDRKNSTHAIFIEPVFTVKVGYKYVKTVFQIGASLRTERSEYFDYQPLIFSIGLQGNIGRIFE